MMHDDVARTRKGDFVFYLGSCGAPELAVTRHASFSDPEVKHSTRVAFVIVWEGEGELMVCVCVCGSGDKEEVKSGP